MSGGMLSRHRLLLRLLLLALAAGCDYAEQHRADSLAALAAAAAADSAAGSIVVAGGSADAGEPATATDSLVAAPSDKARVSTPAADTTQMFATDAELRELAATLRIPVEGVEPAELYDSFTDARGERVHEAIDIHAPRGTPVLAATDGRVLRTHESEAGGLMVYATDASDRFILMYGHLDRYASGLAEGAPLRRGQVVGYVGTSGNAAEDAPHLHFVIARGRPGGSWWRGTPVNPYPLLRGER